MKHEIASTAMPKGPPGRLITCVGGSNSASNPAAPSRELLLNSLEAISRIAAEADSVAAGLSQALTILCTNLKWPIGHVYQRAEPSSSNLTSTAIWYLEGSDQFPAFQELSAHTTFYPGQGLVGQVLAQQRPGLSPDVARDRRFLRRRAARVDNVHAWLAFPIIAEGQVFAVCELLTTEWMPLEHSLASLLMSVGLSLGRLYERELFRQRLDSTAPAARASLSNLAAALSHEINSPLFSARTSLALIAGGLDDQALIASARADLARIAVIMDALQSLRQSPSPDQRLDTFLEPPAA